MEAEAVVAEAEAEAVVAETEHPAAVVVVEAEHPAASEVSEAVHPTMTVVEAEHPGAEHTAEAAAVEEVGPHTRNSTHSTERPSGKVTYGQHRIVVIQCFLFFS